MFCKCLQVSRGGADPCVDEFGQTLIFVTHDRAAAARGDMLITMRDGRIVTTEMLKGTSTETATL